MLWSVSPRERITPLALVFLALSITLRSSDSVLGNEAISGPPGRANASKSRRAMGGIAFAGSSFVAGGERLSQGCKSFGREVRRLTGLVGLALISYPHIDGRPLVQLGIIGRQSARGQYHRQAL